MRATQNNSGEKARPAPADKAAGRATHVGGAGRPGAQGFRPASLILQGGSLAHQGYRLIYMPSLRLHPNLPYGERTHGIAVSNAPVGGAAIARYAFTSPADAAYIGNMFISSIDSLSTYVPGHEATHMLGVSNHTASAWNLMWGEVLPATKGVTGSKRLTAAQINTMRGNAQ